MHLHRKGWGKNDVIHFSMPRSEERKLLWEKCFPQVCQLEVKVDLNDLARNYDLAGDSIINVVQHSSLMALKRGSNTILLKEL